MSVVKNRLQTKWSRYLPVIVVIVGVAGLGIYSLTVSNAASPYVVATAASGRVTSPATVNTDGTAASGKSVVFGTYSSGGGGGTGGSGTGGIPAIPTVSSDPLYPLQQVVNFTGSTLPSQWKDYGDEIQQPAGYVAASHAVFVAGTGLEIEGYPDPISEDNAGVGGVTGGSGDLWDTGSTDATDDGVASSGGFDVAFSMSSGSWQNVHLVIISWPSDDVWAEGENDFFEGNPQDLAINIHEIGSSPATNVWQGNWPQALATGAHVISSRWDPVNGYRFYLDGTLIGTAPIGNGVTTPTTSHHLSIQMQDTTESSTSTETATIYWIATYGYNP